MSNASGESSKIRQLQFLVTEACNIDCVYCYESHKSRKYLSPDFMQRKILEAMTADDDYERIFVDFFGGEPMIKFDNVREVVEWCNAQVWPNPNKTIEFAMTTNGTLLDDERKQWFAAHRDQVRLCLSMDGTPEAQNLNRSGSYDKLAPHLAFFQANWPHQPVKMTVGHRTVDQLYDGVLFLHSLGFAVNADVVFENDWGDKNELSAFVDSFAAQLDRLVDYYAAHPSTPRPDLVTRPIARLFSKVWRREKTLCRAGEDLTCYTATGDEYPCMRFAPITTQNALKRIEDSPDAENPHCATCGFVVICPTCKGHNYQTNGSAWNRTTYNCRFFQASLIATAKLMLRDEPELLSPTDDPEQMRTRATKLLAIRAVNDWCNLGGFPAGAAMSDANSN